MSSPTHRRRLFPRVSSLLLSPRRKSIFHGLRQPTTPLSPHTRYTATARRSARPSPLPTQTPVFSRAPSIRTPFPPMTRQGTKAGGRLQLLLPPSPLRLRHPLLPCLQTARPHQLFPRAPRKRLCPFQPTQRQRASTGSLRELHIHPCLFPSRQLVRPPIAPWCRPSPTDRRIPIMSGAVHRASRQPETISSRSP